MFRPVEKWPRLLLGPMVRRVTAERAHFFVATRMACEASVALFLGRQAHDQAGASIAASTPQALFRIGERLYVGLISVDIPGDIAAAGSLLSYDLTITDTADGSARQLFELGLLGGDSALVGEEWDVNRAAYPLGYEAGRLPAFVVPPNSPNALRVVHGSCRKPHGGGSTEADALQLMDKAIADTVSAADHSERPQQLILTGDQIYADDVAPALLASLTPAGEALLGWDEELPLVLDNAGVTGLSGDHDLSFLVQPGWRTRYLSIRGVDLKKPVANGEVDYSQSHLLRFSEWVAMYVYAWSDALWPRKGDGLGTPGDPTNPSSDIDKAYELPKPEHLLPLDDIGQVLTLVATNATFDFPREIGEAVEAADVHLQGHQKAVIDNWKTTKPKAERYGNAVHCARRVLANCATYTMFDDHEITDDWYVSRRVHDKLKGDTPASFGSRREVGPRLLRNGLSAYAIFQHWGNAPEDFGQGRQGQRLLDKWAFDPGARTCPLKDDPVDPEAFTLLGIDPGDSPIPAGAGRADFVRLRWDYSVGFAAHRLVALDTRTWREFPIGNPLSWSELAQHLPTVDNSGRATAAGQHLSSIAAAWRDAGAGLGEQLLEDFGALIDSFIALVTAGAGSLDELRQRGAELIAAFTRFRDTLAQRNALPVAERLNPAEIIIDIPLVGTDVDANRAELDSLGEDKAVLQSHLLHALFSLKDSDFGFGTRLLNALFDALHDLVAAAWASSPIGIVHAVSRAAGHADARAWRLLTSVSTGDPAHATLEGTLEAEAAAVRQLADTTGLDALGSAVFRSGDNRLAPGLIRHDALPFMLIDPLQRVAPGADVTILLSPAPVFGNRLVEMAQRLNVIRLVASGEAGEEIMDFEPWSGNIPSMINLFEAAASLDSAIILSGDVHYAGSMVVDVKLPRANTRYLQFTSSSTRNSDSATRSLGKLDDLLYDRHGTIFYQQADWISLLEHGASSLEQLESMAWAAVQQKMRALKNSLDPRRHYETFKVWWNGDLITLEQVMASVDRLAQAPANTWRTLSTEVSWQLFAAVDLIQAVRDDPLLKIFGDYLSAPAVLRQQLSEFHQSIGSDPSNGLNCAETVLVDQRRPRLTLYPQAQGRYQAGTAESEEIDNQYRRTVGHANLGFIRFLTRGVAPLSEVTEVQHELRWYPKDAPKRQFNVVTSKFDDPQPRPDWYGTLHRAGWVGFPPDPAPARASE